MKRAVFLIYAAAQAILHAYAESVVSAKLKKIYLYGDPSVVTNVTFDGLARAVDVTNCVEDAISRIPSADFTESNKVLVATIRATSPEPGDYPSVSNRAMNAVQDLSQATNYANIAVSELVRTNSVLSGGPYLKEHQSLQPAFEHADAVAFIAADDATNYTDRVASGKADRSETYTKSETDDKIVELSPPPGNYSIVSNNAMTALQEHQSLWPATNYTDHAISELARTNSVLSGGPYLTEHQSLDPATNYANDVAFRAADDATNYTDSVASGKADKSSVYTKSETDAKIVELAPAPGNYQTVSNKAMTAIQSLQPALEHADSAAFGAANDATNYTNKAISEIPDPDFTTGNAVLVSTIEAKAPAPGNYSTVSNKAMTAVQTLEPSTNYADFAIVELARTNSVLSGGPYLTGHQSLEPATNYTDYAILELSKTNAVLSGGPYLTSHQTLDPATNYADAVAFRAADDATNYTDSSISSGNPAFVNAVTNCPVVIASSDASTIGEFGGYGTLGALLAALAAAITWLKSNKADKTDLPYAIVTPTVTNGEAALVDRAINFIPQDTAFSGAVLPSGTSGKARDFVFRFVLSDDTYIGFSGTDASGSVIQWLKGDPSGTFAAGENMIGISEVAQGVFSASDMFALDGVENALDEINNGSGS